MPDLSGEVPDYLPEPPVLPIDSEQNIFYSAPPVPPLISEPHYEE